MSKHFTKPHAQGKPERPEGSPFFWHRTGGWAKKIRGQLVYFGRISHDDAMADYAQRREELHSGRASRDSEDCLTVYLLCGKFWDAKKAKLDNGEISPRTFKEYDSACKLLIKTFGKSRLVSDLQPDDFAKLRAAMAKRWGVVRLKAEIVRSRTVFNWALKNLLIKTPPAFGEEFSVPTAKVLRKHRAAQGEKMFVADEIRRMLDTARQPIKAMIMLGVNCGFGNNDISTLPIDALDLERGWVKHARPKTGVARRCPLWPETIEALRDWLAVRPTPKNEADAGLVFITYKLGNWLDEGSGSRSLSHEMRKLLDSLGIDGARSFYALRHTMQTVGDECGDFLAVRRIMGHAGGNDIGDVYRERITDQRLQKVTDHVRAWLFGEHDGGEGAKPAAEKPRLRIVG
jgi:integrase